VKRQLRQTAMATIADIVAREDDPLLEHWL
jgi:hypothetical protein